MRAASPISARAAPRSARWARAHPRVKRADTRSISADVLSSAVSEASAAESVARASPVAFRSNARLPQATPKYLGLEDLAASRVTRVSESIAAGIEPLTDVSIVKREVAAIARP